LPSQASTPLVTGSRVGSPSLSQEMEKNLLQRPNRAPKPKVGRSHIIAQSHQPIQAKHPRPMLRSLPCHPNLVYLLRDEQVLLWHNVQDLLRLNVTPYQLTQTAQPQPWITCAYLQTRVLLLYRRTLCPPTQRQRHSTRRTWDIERSKM
jgi:hypothetical protein